MAPVERRLQGLLPLHATASTGEEAEPVVELLEDLLGRQVPYARRGELDRERDAIEASAQVGDRWSVGERELERRANSPEPARQTARLPRSRSRRREAARAMAPPMSARRRPGAASRLVASTVSTRARALQAVDERGQRLQQVLAVVEHEQARSRHEVADRPRPLATPSRRPCRRLRWRQPSGRARPQRQPAVRRHRRGR